MVLTDAERSSEIAQRLLKKYRTSTDPADLKSRCGECLKTLKAKDPQYELSGCRNIWILKPNCKTAKLS